MNPTQHTNAFEDFIAKYSDVLIPILKRMADK